jgi:photosynthetic reaction center cytochrome c subunit
MSGLARFITLGAAASGALLLGGCELGRKDVEQTGYRGTGMEQVTDVSSVTAASAIPAPPYDLPADTGPRASQTYQNVRVLGDVSTERFDHLMASMNQWVVPANVAPAEQGCNYCHNPENLASDEKYTKVVARRMLEMTRAINGRWSSHVKETGVTCYTCHRGNAVPEFKWANADESSGLKTIRGNKRGQNTPDPNIGYASLPTDAFARYFQGDAAREIRVASDKALPSPGHRASIKDAEESYALMMHVSSALGVNCTYCHNTQSFRAWNLSRAQRATAFYGIRMVRDTNGQYITPLASVFPANRKGPHGDPYKINCTTCHQGQSKPLGGISMLPLNPALRAAPVATAPAEGGPGAETAVPEAFNNPAAMTDNQ